MLSAITGIIGCLIGGVGLYFSWYGSIRSPKAYTDLVQTFQKNRPYYVQNPEHRIHDNYTPILDYLELIVPIVQAKIKRNFTLLATFVISTAAFTGIDLQKYPNIVGTLEVVDFFIYFINIILILWFVSNQFLVNAEEKKLIKNYNALLSIFYKDYIFNKLKTINEHITLMQSNNISMYEEEFKVWTREVNKSVEKLKRAQAKILKSQNLK